MGKTVGFLLFLLVFLPGSGRSQESFSSLRGAGKSGHEPSPNLARLSSGALEKRLQVKAQVPKFLRQGDHAELPIVLINETDSSLTGQVQLQLMDPLSHLPVDGWFSNRQPNQYFTAAAGQRMTIYFPIDIPYEFNKVLECKVAAFAGEAVQGRESALADSDAVMLPVLPSRKLVTESINLSLSGSREFGFEAFEKTIASESVSPYAFTLEWAADPGAFACLSLPYLIQFPRVSAEEQFHKFFALSLARRISSTVSGIRQAPQDGQRNGAGLPDINQELRSLLLAEAPWMLNEGLEEQENLLQSLLADSNRLAEEERNTVNGLRNLQLARGGFSWYPGGPEDLYITQYILTGLGRLNRLGALPVASQAAAKEIERRALAWADGKIAMAYPSVARDRAGAQWNASIQPEQIQWLYMRSFYPDMPLESTSSHVYENLLTQASRHWVSLGPVQQAMIAITLLRNGQDKMARQIMATLIKSKIPQGGPALSFQNKQKGLPWQENASLLLEAITEIVPDKKNVDDLLDWLLGQKLVSNWPGTKATADACYAIALGKPDQQKTLPALRISLGQKKLEPVPAGSAYWMKSVLPPFIRPGMGKIGIDASAGSPALGFCFWQFFEDEDLAPSPARAGATLSLTRKIFFTDKKAGKGKPKALVENETLHTGNRIMVSLEIRAGKDFEYLHLEDLTAACTEPVSRQNVFHTAGNLAYYEMAQDASVHFFFPHLRKGVYTINYELLITMPGTYYLGQAGAESPIEPVFSAHSNLARLTVQESD